MYRKKKQDKLFKINQEEEKSQPVPEEDTNDDSGSERTNDDSGSERTNDDSGSERTNVYFTIICLFVAAVVIARLLNYKVYREPEQPLNRLRHFVKPVHYDVVVSPIKSSDYPVFEFMGQVKILILMMKDSQKIILHSKQMEIDLVQLNNEILESFTFEDEYLVIESPVKLRTGTYHSIWILFSAELNDDSYGLGKATYDFNNQEWLSFMTQFDPTYAPHVFPCFEESEDTAKFTVTVGRKINMKTFSRLNQTSNDSIHQTLKLTEFYNELSRGLSVELPCHTNYISMESFMDSWINQDGFPMVSVERHDGFLKFSQTKFINLYADQGNDFGGLSDNPLWYAPIAYIIQNKRKDAKNLTLRDTKEETIYTPIPRRSEMIILNPNEMGFYRIHYQETDWDNIIQYLCDKNHIKEIPAVTRAQLIDESMTLAKLGYLDYTIIFDLLKYLKYETEYYPWSLAINGLEFIDSMIMSHSDYITQFKRAMKRLVQVMYHYVSSISPSSFILYKRQSEIIKWACHVNLDNCTTISNNWMSAWMNLPTSEINPIPAHLRSTVYCSTIREGVLDNWEFLWNQYKTETSINEQNNILVGLSCTQSPKQLADYLTVVLNNNQIDSQQFYKIINQATNYVIGQDGVIDFISRNSERIKARFGTFEKLLKNTNLISKINKINLKEKVNKYAFVDVSETHVARYNHIMNANIFWMRKNLKYILNILKKFSV